MQLYTAFIFSHKIEVNRVTRFFLNKTTKEAEKYLSKNDRTLKFINAKITCEVNNKLTISNYSIQIIDRLRFRAFNGYLTFF